MTELPRKLGVRAAYETCRRIVGPIFGLALAATGAQAGAWEEFERRCLVPMENFESPIFDGLRMVAGGGDYSMFMDAGIALTVYPSGKDGKGCMVNGVDSFDKDQVLLSTTRKEIIDRALAHFAEEVTRGRYTFVDECEDTYKSTTFTTCVLRSNLWREPVLEVTLEIWPTHGNVTVRETDLES